MRQSWDFGLEKLNSFLPFWHKDENFCRFIISVLNKGWRVAAVWHLLSHVNKRVPKWLFLLANDSIKLYGLEVKNLRLIRKRREREARGVTTAKCNFWGVPTLPYVFLDIVHPTKRLYFAIIVYCASAALLSSVAQFGIFWQHCHSFLCEYSPKENMGERRGFLLHN